MNLKTFFKALKVKAIRSKPVSKKLAKSYASLFLVMLLGITNVFAWFTERKIADISANTLEFQSASSLRINKDDIASSTIIIDRCVLDEASSTDGRNIYFPLGESFTTISDDMQFREGNTGDRNVRYVYKDFSLKGSSGNTPVYIKSYEIKVEEADSPHDPSVNATYHDHLEIGYSNGKPNSQNLPPDHCPIRLAFISDSGQNPIVIDPSAQVVDYVDNSNNAVSLIDDNGEPKTVNTNDNNNNWNSFSTYYYGNTPLFVIPGGQSLDVTLVVWLEGSIEDSDKYIGKKISVDIDIESNFPEMDTITFVDGSYGDTDTSAGARYWVSNDNPIFACAYEDPYSTETPKRWKTVIMRKTKEKVDNVSGAEWQCKIPKKAVTNISFYRLSHTNTNSSIETPTNPQGTIFNSWHTSASVMSWRNTNIDSWLTQGNLQSTRQYSQDGNTYNALVYTAVRGNGYEVTTTSSERLSPCVGYWNYTGGSGSGTSGGGSGSGGSGSGSGGGGSASGGSSTYQITVNVNTSNKTWIDTNVQGGDKLWFWTNNGNFQLNRTGSNSFTWSGSLQANDEIIGFYITNSSGNGYKNFSVTATHTVTANWNVNYYINNDDVMVLNS